MSDGERSARDRDDRRRGGSRDRERERDRSRDSGKDKYRRRDSDRDRDRDRYRHRDRESERGRDRDSERDHDYAGKRKREDEYDSRGKIRREETHQERFRGGGGRDDGARGRGGGRGRGRGRSRRDLGEHNSADFEWGRREEQSRDKQGQGEGTESAGDKQAPSFELSGALAAETNEVNGIVLKYNEPTEAKIPRAQWSLFPFKNDEALDKISLKKKSMFLLGREIQVVDIMLAHPSCSKQHAVIQFREVPAKDDIGIEIPGKMVVKPYIIDLESTNATQLNDEKIEARRYFELKAKDVLKFGYSSREYVLLNESVAGSE